MKKFKGIISIMLVIPAIAFSGCDMAGDEEYWDMEMMEEEPVVNVETAYPTVRTIERAGSYIGTIETGEKVPVIPRVSGYVREKNFNKGDFVCAGDVLFTIDDSDLLLEKKKAEADLRDANASLAKDKAENESTKFEVNETLNTLDTQTQANYNDIQSAIRSEYESQLDLYKACAEENILKKEGDYLEDMIRKDKEGLENAKDFTRMLGNFKSAYNSIKNAGDLQSAIDMARNKYGVSQADITAAAPADAAAVAVVYLKRKAMYESEDMLNEAISTSEAAQEELREKKYQDESADRQNDISIISDEYDAQKQKSYIASAQENIAFKRKVAADYEIYTKAKIWAASQAKLAAGDAAVLSANVMVSKAQIDLEIAERRLQYTTVTSPVSGEIIECTVENAALASDSDPAYTIIDTSKKKAVFYVSADAKNNMTVGQKVTVEQKENRFVATIDHISDAPDEKKLLYRVSAILTENDKSEIDAGSSVRINTCIQKSENTMTIPIDVIYYDEGKPFVYVAKDNTAVKTMIETGISDKNDIEVLSGLTSDDRIIVNWADQLQDNAEVNIIKTADRIVADTPIEDTVTEEPEAGAEHETGAEADRAEANEIHETSAYVETTANVNIRKDPTRDSERLETARKGTKFKKIGEESGGWTKIEYNGTEAYVSSDYVRECEE